jgi:hypothetical protein
MAKPKRVQKNPGYWDNKGTQRDFMDGLGNQLGFKYMTDWYKITSNQITNNGGFSLLAKFGSSPPKMVTSIYHSHPWNFTKFQSKPKHYWESDDNQREFMDQLGKQLGFKDMDDWYNLTLHEIDENRGSGLLEKYNRSPSKLVMSTYFNYPWNTSNFNRRLSAKHWAKEDNRISVIKSLTQDLRIKNLNEWYRISLSQIANHYQHMKVFREYSLDKLLVAAFPNHSWNSAELIPQRYILFQQYNSSMYGCAFDSEWYQEKEGPGINFNRNRNF